MAVRNITEFPTTTDIFTDDILHLGRTVAREPTNSLRDKSITGAAFFNNMNQVAGVFGAPLVVGGSITTSPIDVTGFSSDTGTSPGGSVPNASAGTITIGVTGIWQVSGSLVWTGGINYNLTTYLNDNGVQTIVDGYHVDSGGAQNTTVIRARFSTLINLTAGHVIKLQLKASAAKTAVFTNGSFTARPVQL